MDSMTAAVIVVIIEAATDGNWPNTKDGLEEAGITPKDACAAVKVLTDLAGQSELFTEADF